ncbi:Pan1 protein [Martiniozyma asiatica (nom. inval.)]|nr:Pan1 protein [Martiniozyma asiatica]
MYPYGNQQQYGYNSNQQTQLQSQPTGYGFGQPQTSFQPQQTGFQQQNWSNQQAGWNQQPQQQQQQQPQQQQQQQQQQTASLFMPQQTGGLMSQQTGYQSQQLPFTSFQSQPTGGIMSQQTGYQQQPMTSFQSQLTGGLMSQQGGYQQQQQPLQQQQQQQPLVSQTTGWNQMPQTSFGQIQPQNTGWMQSQPTGHPLTAQPTGFISSLNGSQKNTMELPNMRLSFISSRDQDRFESIFRSNVANGEKAMNASTAKNILMKSNLSAVQLLDIWELADTSKTGSLLFPEFCIALHLANLARKGDSIPRELPLSIKNEVTGFVDAINFDVGMKSNNVENSSNAFVQQQSQQTGYGMAPLQAQRTGLTPLAPQQTSGLIPMQNGGGLQSQPTGFFNQLLGQPTGNGGLIAQATGSAPPMTSFMAQPTGGLMPQTTGMMPQTTGMMPQTTGMMSQTTGMMPQATGLQPMPTGRPGQWGFVSAPTGGLPGLEMMQSHFMPNAQSQVTHLHDQMGGMNASVSWAITKQEKMVYDGIFKQWDKERNGFVNGDVAIEVFGKSGLNNTDLEKIWTLSDRGNKGKLNKDEFAVAMHLIYRRLNGLEIPISLPPELIPPSSKVLENTVDDLKGQLRRQSTFGKNVNNLKNNVSTTGSTFKNNDDDIQYVSKSRHRIKKSDEEQDEAFSTKLSIEDLKKKIKEKKILLAAIDAEDEDLSPDYGKQKSLNEIELLKTQIKSTQSQLNQCGDDSGSLADKEKLQARLNYFSDRVPQLVDAIASVDEQIKSSKIELYRLHLEKENPSGFEIRGTGPRGEITDRDRRIAKQKAEVQAKIAKLTNKPAPNFEAYEHNENKLSSEILKITGETEDQKSMVKDIAMSIKGLITDIGSSLNLTNSMSVGYSKWEQKEGVQNQEVKDFIDYLNSTKPKFTETKKPAVSAANNVVSQNIPKSSLQQNNDTAVPTGVLSSSTPVSKTGLTAAEERTKKIKEDAQRRMNERLAKLGIKRKPSATYISPQPNSNEPSLPATPISTPVPEQNIPVTKEIIPESTASQTRRAAPPPPVRASKPVVEAESHNEEGESESEDDEDEEIKMLMAKKKELEERKKQKKLEKEKRIAKLRAEMAALEDGNDSDDSWDEPKKEIKLEKSEDKPVETSSPAIPEVLNKQSNNPFASMLSKKDEIPNGSLSSTSSSSTNPFSKQMATAAPLTETPTGSVIDSSKLKAQREAQRGISKEDNGWSDSENDEEDEMPTGAKQAELASMLFGGSSQPSRSSTFIPPAPEAKNVQAEKAETEVKVEVKPEEETKSSPIPVFPPPIEKTEDKQNGINISTESLESSLPSSSVPPIPSTMPPIPNSSLKLEALPMDGSNGSSDFYDAQSQPVENDDDSHDDDSSFIASSPEVEPVEPADLPPPLPTAIPPPPPPAAAPVFDVGSAAPPTAPPPPPLAPSVTGGPPTVNTISNLLGEISLGKSLKKVENSEKKESTGATVGRVLD